MAGGFRAGLMCRADLASLPSRGETIEKCLKVGISVSGGVRVFASRQACEVSLHCSDFVQQPQRVGGHRDCSETLFRGFVHVAGVQEASKHGVAGRRYRFFTRAPSRRLSSSLNEG